MALTYCLLGLILNYQKIYDALVEKAKVRGLDKGKYEGYVEKHHVLPRCLGGTDDSNNLVLLTAREHYIAHILLWKIYPNDPNLFHAAWMMSNRSLQKRNSRMYAMLREKHVELLSERSEFNNPNFKDLTGHVSERLTVVEFAGWTQQSKGKRTSTWSCQCECGETIVLPARSLNGKWAQKSCGCFKRDASKQAVGDKNPFYGKTHSDEAKAKMRERKVGKPSNQLGVKRSEETIQRIKDSLKNVKRIPWKHNTASKDKWHLAGYYYSLYLQFPELTKYEFATMFNETHNDSVGMHYFVPFIDRFKLGWIPTEDHDWIAFKEEYERS